MKHLLNTAIALLIMQSTAIAQQAGIMRDTGNVSRAVLQFILRASGGLEPDGSLKTAISMERIYGYCPQSGQWIHALEFDPTTFIIFIVDTCQLTAIDYRLPTSGGS